MQILLYIYIPAVLSFNNSDFSGEKQMKRNILQCWGWLQEMQIEVSCLPPSEQRLELEAYYSRSSNECKSVSAS